MDNQSQTNLKSAAFTLIGLIALFENDHVNESVRSDLVSVRDNIEKQIDALSIIEDTKQVFTASTPVAPIPPKRMENTYRIEEETTVGWAGIDDKYNNLSKEKAKESYDQLLSTGDFNPSRLRLVVDGHV